MNIIITSDYGIDRNDILQKLVIYSALYNKRICIRESFDEATPVDTIDIICNNKVPDIMKGSDTYWAIQTSESKIKLVRGIKCPSAEKAVYCIRKNRIVILGSPDVEKMANALTIWDPANRPVKRKLKRSKDRFKEKFKPLELNDTSKEQLVNCINSGIKNEIDQVQQRIDLSKKTIERTMNILAEQNQILSQDNIILDGLRSQLENDQGRIDNILNMLALIPTKGMFTKIEIDEEGIHGFTNDIYMEHDNKFYNMKRYEILLGWKGNVGVRTLDGVKPLSLRDNYCHPHVEGGTGMEWGNCCLGNLSLTIPKLISNTNYDMALNLLYQFLSSYNSSNPFAQLHLYSNYEVTDETELNKITNILD